MAYITCPSCNKRITDKTPFCRFCGKAHGVSPSPAQSSAPKSAESTSEEQTPSDTVRTKRKKSTQSVPRTPKLPDQTRQNAIRRFILHAILSPIGAALSAVVGMLLGELGNMLFTTISSENSGAVAMLILSFIGAAVVALIFGAVGPIAKESFRPAQDKPFIIYAKAEPLKKLSFAYYAFFAAALSFFLITQLGAWEQVKGLIGSDAKEYYAFFISYCVVAYYLVFPLATYMHVCFASCPGCGCIDCKIKIGESAHEVETKTQTRERTYAGASYDVYSSSGTHVGTIRAQDSTVEESREVSTESWENYCRCVICGKVGSEKAFKTTKTKWK